MNQTGEYYYQGSTSTYGNGGMDPYNSSANYGMNNNSYGNNAYGGSVAPSTPTKSTTPKQEVPIVCSMIGKIITQADGTFNYFNSPIKNVCLVGLVSSYRVNATNGIDYVINDCTGTISGRCFSDPNNIPITEGYVIVNCSLRFFQDQTSLNIYNIQPITNMNLITEHLLNCIICYEFYKKRAGVNVDSFSMQTNDYMNNASDLDSIEQTIYSFIKSKMDLPEYMDGVSLDTIVAYCASKGISENDVKFRIEEMVSNIRLFESGPEVYKCQ